MLTLEVTGTRVSFSLWRREIALAAGLIADKNNLYTVEDKIKWDFFEKKTDFLGYWKEHPGDPIWFLIAHKDTEGIITWQQASELSKRLKSLISALPGKESYPNFQVMTKKIISTLNKAAKAQEDITFS
jgi:hypothetical protein